MRVPVVIRVFENATGVAGAEVNGEKRVILGWPAFLQLVNEARLHGEIFGPVLSSGMEKMIVFVGVLDYREG